MGAATGSGLGGQSVRGPPPGVDDAVHGRRNDLVTGIAGLLLTALILAGFLTPETPSASDSAEGIARALTTDRAGHQLSLFLGFLADVASSCSSPACGAACGGTRAPAAWRRRCSARRGCLRRHHPDLRGPLPGPAHGRRRAVRPGGAARHGGPPRLGGIEHRPGRRGDVPGRGVRQPEHPGAAGVDRLAGRGGGVPADREHGRDLRVRHGRGRHRARRLPRLPAVPGLDAGDQHRPAAAEGAADRTGRERTSGHGDVGGLAGAPLSPRAGRPRGPGWPPACGWPAPAWPAAGRRRSSPSPR